MDIVVIKIINNITNSNDYFTIVKSLSVQDINEIKSRYSVFCEPEADCVDIMKNIYAKMFENQNTCISGNLILTEAFVAAQQDANIKFANETIKKIEEADAEELPEILAKEPLDVIVSSIANTNALKKKRKRINKRRNKKCFHNK